MMLETENIAAAAAAASFWMLNTVVQGVAAVDTPVGRCSFFDPRQYNLIQFIKQRPNVRARTKQSTDARNGK